MTAVLVNLPDNIKQESTKVAKQLGLSRTEFIKQAIIHELNSLKKQRAEEKIAQSFKAMKRSKTYVLESEEIMDNLNSEIAADQEWWKKK